MKTYVTMLIASITLLIIGSTYRFINSLRVYDVGDRGNGLFITQSCPANQIILEYTGELLDYPEYHHRKASNWNMNYVMALSEITFIDGHRYGSIASFINHSHLPNVTYEQWHCSGKKKLLISSSREISASVEHPTEILANYGWTLDSDDDRAKSTIIHATVELQAALDHYIVTTIMTIRATVTSTKALKFLFRCYKNRSVEYSQLIQMNQLNQLS